MVAAAAGGQTDFQNTRYEAYIIIILNYNSNYYWYFTINFHTQKDEE